MTRRRKINYTSIETDPAEEFLRNADENKTLKCNKIRGFFLLKKAKYGVWRYRYMSDIGKRRTVTVGPYSKLLPNDAAKIVHDWIENDVDPLKDKTDRRQTAQTALREAEQRYLGHYLEKVYRPMMEREWQHNAAKVNYQRIKTHFAYLSERDMATLRKADILEWQSGMDAKGRQYSTVKRVYSSLQTMLRQAVTDGYLDGNPLSGIKVMPSAEQQQIKDEDPHKTERRMLEPDELQGIYRGLERMADDARQARRNTRQHSKGSDLPDLDAVEYPHWFEPFCLLALLTGLRPGDLYTLTWSELNMETGQLRKFPEKTRFVAQRRGRQPTLIEHELGPEHIDIMKPWWAQQGKPTTGLVFPSPRTGRQMSNKAHIKPWGRALELGGVTSNLTFYSCRHHFISAQVAAGSNLLKVIRMAGHKSIAMIEAHYGHLSQDSRQEALTVVTGSLGLGSRRTK